MAGTYRSIDAAAAKKIFDNGAHMIDVRYEDEWHAGHVEGADRITPGTANKHSVGRADTVVAVCRNGNASRRAAKRLAKQGYQVYHLDGGLKAWEAAGLPLVSTNGGRARIV